MNKKQRRFHKNVYFPTWADENLTEFTAKIKKQKSLVFSIHALEKTVGYSFEYGRKFLKYLMKSVRRTSLDISNIFEFYSTYGTVQKCCFRFSYEDFPVDIVLVISADGTVVTVFITNKKDFHTSMDDTPYEKKD